MSEQLRESLSALMDGEANELEMERVLSRIADDPELRRAWVRYNAARSVLSGQSLVRLDHDISAAVRGAILSPAGGKRERSRVVERWWRPVASLAVAASVAATVVIGGQQLARLGAVNGYPSDGSMAASASPVGLVNSLGASPVRASFGTEAVPVLQPATHTAYRELARQRMEKYLQEHAEHAALNSPQGLVPFARVAEIRE